MPARPATLKARVDQATHERFLALAHARGLTESELLRLAIHREIDSTAPIRVPAVPLPDQTTPSRVTVRTSAFILSAAQSRAQSQGMALSRWIASLMQSNLSTHPVLTDTEVHAVQTTTRELAALGRNINQIARALNEAPFQTERVRLDSLAELSDKIEHVRQAIRSLVRASRNAWGVTE